MNQKNKNKKKNKSWIKEVFICLIHVYWSSTLCQVPCKGFEEHITSLQETLEQLCKVGGL